MSQKSRMTNATTMTWETRAWPIMAMRSHTELLSKRTIYSAGKTMTSKILTHYDTVYNHSKWIKKIEIQSCATCAMLC